MAWDWQFHSYSNCPDKLRNTECASPKVMSFCQKLVPPFNSSTPLVIISERSHRLVMTLLRPSSDRLMDGRYQVHYPLLR